ncbi:MAG: thioredoxin domain-containing protein, partial [Gemmatimonadetes bacterium]|nr:thioredoxin domain-containing protein [Gemmatimonadota bacterium]
MWPRFHGAEHQLENTLAGATSPYLRSAAQQPVAWQEWGPAAFRLAERLDRPIWLDIGAVWCHWCHVMDRESYEDSAIAALINAAFVPVKVDRDERPDIDGRYQAAHQALNGRGGGWPLTMFLTPSGEPFAGGTYFPPDGRGGLPGLRQLAPRVAAAYRERRDEVADLARRVRAQLAAVRANAFAAGELDERLPAVIAGQLRTEFDTVFGGLGQGEGPKFPNGEAIRLALAGGFLTDDDALMRAGLLTLDAYARSGMRDHVNGGFFRYGVNRRLTVPHFEKMDYVQGALLAAYLDAYRLTGREHYAAVARDIRRYVDGTLSDRGRGGFYAHQDADVSLDDDGSYYTWSLAQLQSAVPPDGAEALRRYYDIESAGEMREDPSQNVLRIARSPLEVARALGISARAAQERIVAGTGLLAQARQSERAPFIEQTVYTDRNGMMIAAYLDAYETLGDT